MGVRGCASAERPKTIHPYVDGNGRIGRLLIHRLLPAGAAPVPVALGLLNDPDRYVAGLRHYAAGDLDTWIGTFADAIVLGSSAAQRIIARIDQLRDDYRLRVRTRRGSTVPAVIDALLSSPAVTTRSIEDRFGVTEARAQQILHQLADSKILQRSNMRAGGRRVWIAPDVIDAVDYWCENTDDGMICHPPDTPKPEPATVTEFDDWAPPEAGMVPEVHPDTPLAEWQRGPVDPEGIAYDKPRATAKVVGWTNWCYYTWSRGGCDQLLHYMHQALDHLGAHPLCVLNMYTDRVEYIVAQGAGYNSSYAKNSFGWHLCATVIDPYAFDFPAEARENDAGLRLSDTAGITLAERCRRVLTGPFPDIQLDDRISPNERERGVTPAQFGQDCDAWAAWVQEEGLVRSAPACSESSALAEEWMEHVHNQHERYFRPHC